MLNASTCAIPISKNLPSNAKASINPNVKTVQTKISFCQGIWFSTTCQTPCLSFFVFGKIQLNLAHVFPITVKNTAYLVQMHKLLPENL